MKGQSSAASASLAAGLLITWAIGCAAASDVCPLYSTSYVVPDMAPLVSSTCVLLLLGSKCNCLTLYGNSSLAETIVLFDNKCSNDIASNMWTVGDNMLAANQQAEFTAPRPPAQVPLLHHYKKIQGSIALIIVCRSEYEAYEAYGSNRISCSSL